MAKNKDNQDKTVLAENINHLDENHDTVSLQILDTDVRGDESNGGLALEKVEEVKDYEILNIITEEITVVHTLEQAGSLKEVLKGSLSGESLHLDSRSLVSDLELEQFVSKVELPDSKVCIHNIDNMSYLEIVDQDNSSYHLQMSGNNHVYQLDNNDLDAFLVNFIENTAPKT